MKATRKTIALEATNEEDRIQVSGHVWRVAMERRVRFEALCVEQFRRVVVVVFFVVVVVVNQIGGARA